MSARRTMRAAVLERYDGTPSAQPFVEPVAGSRAEVVVEVAAAGLNHVDLLKASGRFYGGAPPLPSVVGTDGVGRLGDGRRVYFDACVAPYGALAERTLVGCDDLLDVAEGVPDALAAALGNAGLAAWLGLSHRAGLQEGETVVVLGAGGAVGSVAVQAARLLGAGSVVAVTRSGASAGRLRELGADAVVGMDEALDLAEAIRDAAGGGQDVTIDPVWGEPALAALRAAGPAARHVQLGQLAGVELALPAPVLRAAGIDLRGFAIFQAPLAVRRAAYLALTGHAARGELTVAHETVPLDGIASAWERQRSGPGAKLVVTLS